MSNEENLSENIKETNINHENLDNCEPKSHLENSKEIKENTLADATQLSARGVVNEIDTNVITNTNTIIVENHEDLNINISNTNTALVENANNSIEATVILSSQNIQIDN